MNFPDDYPHIGREDMKYLIDKIGQQYFVLDQLLGTRAMNTLRAILPRDMIGVSRGYEQIVEDQDKSWTT